nr:hypothetical protein CFP56_11557 [Quercus suber]
MPAWLRAMIKSSTDTFPTVTFSYGDVHNGRWERYTLSWNKGYGMSLLGFSMQPEKTPSTTKRMGQRILRFSDGDKFTTSRTCFGSPNVLPNAVFKLGKAVLMDLYNPPPGFLWPGFANLHSRYARKRRSRVLLQHTSSGRQHQLYQVMRMYRPGHSPFAVNEYRSGISISLLPVLETGLHPGHPVMFAARIGRISAACITLRTAHHTISETLRGEVVEMPFTAISTEASAKDLKMDRSQGAKWAMSPGSRGYAREPRATFKGVWESAKSPPQLYRGGRHAM